VTTFSVRDEMFPVNLGEQDPDRQFLGRALLERSEDPVHVVFFIKEMLNIEVSTQTNSIIHLLRPSSLSAAGNDSIDELFDKHCPFSDPFEFTGQSSGTRDTFPFESTDLVSSDALGKPDSSGDGNILGNTMVEENLATNTMGNGSTKLSQWHFWVSKILEPSFSFCVGQGDSWWRLESGRGSAETHLRPLVQDLDKEGGQYAQSILVLQARPEVRTSDVGLSLRSTSRLVAVSGLDEVLVQHIFRVLAFDVGPWEEIGSLVSWKGSCDCRWL
jgi:hypothetical protein